MFEGQIHKLYLNTFIVSALDTFVKYWNCQSSVFISAENFCMTFLFCLFWLYLNKYVWRLGGIAIFVCEIRDMEGYSSSSLNAISILIRWHRQKPILQMDLSDWIPEKNGLFKGQRKLRMRKYVSESEDSRTRVSVCLSPKLSVTWNTWWLSLECLPLECYKLCYQTTLIK